MMGRNKSSRRPDVPIKSKLKKDPGVPRLPSLKVRSAEKQRLHQAIPKNPDGDATMASEPTLSSLAALAEAASSSSEPSTSHAHDPASGKIQTKEQQRRHFVRTLHKVIEESDVVVLVLDARDPEGTRSRLVEEEVRRREADGKRLVFVLNKVDLVPQSNAQAWLRHLRHTTPTLPFRSVTSSSAPSSTTAPALLKLLKAYRPSGKQSITIGVVGYPNVGKSSLVNALKKAKVCPVAAQPGHTTTLQTVHLERGVRIVDSPGVIFDDDNDTGDFKRSKAGASLHLRNVMKVEDIEDPIEVVEEILARVDPEAMSKIYNLPPNPGSETGFGSTLEFLTMLALTSGRLLKGGTPDILGVARHVLNDWNHQKIPYFSNPPTVHPSSLPTMLPSSSTGEAVVAPGAENVGQARIINQFGKAFELNGLFGLADDGAFNPDSDQNMAVEDEAQEDDTLMDNAADHMVEDDSPTKSLKRARSQTPTPSIQGGLPASHRAPSPQPTRPPKRMRRMHAADPIAPTALAGMGRANPLNRRALKREAKRARKVGRVSHAHPATAGMEVDDDERRSGGFSFGLGGTFFADLGGLPGVAGMTVST